MENPSQEVLQMCKPIIDIILADRKQAIYELQFCDTVEKCNEWKRKYLGKDSVTSQVLRELGKWKD